MKNFARREFMASRLWQPVFLKQNKQTHQGILVWNKNIRLHTLYKKHMYKEGKETKNGKIGE